MGIETGRIGISGPDLDLLLELYRVPDGHAETLRRLAPDQRARGWWDAYADSLSTGYATLLRLEHGSRALRCYGAVLPPTLLMTVEYARQTMLATWQTPSPQDLDRYMKSEIARWSKVVREAGIKVEQ